ncbi:MAG TPA: hypothetical protein VD866_12235, partial [Urbifossiella sp.]|nr:hypothetical protein [Urbifossiella sp.]
MSDPVTPAARAVGFVGARALRAGDLLAGRDGELADITNLVVAERVVLLYSPSGAGKTSLLQAGLVPALRRRKQYVPLGDDPDGAAPPQFLLPDAFDPDGRPTGQPVVVRVNTPPDSDAPANRYVRSAVLALHSGLPPTVRLPDADLNGISLCEYLSRAYPSAATAPADDDPDDDPPDPSYPVLIFDQFEEALTLDPADEEDKQAFFQDLGRAAADRSRWFVFAMREDHLAELEPYLGYLPRWLAARLRIDRLKRDPAADAVKQIVDNAGYPIEKTTAEALVDKLRTLTESRADEGFKAQEARAGKQRMYPTVEPLFVQVVGLRLLTDRKPKTEVTRQDVDAIDVERVLASYFAEEVEAATGGDRQVERWTRLWFDRALLNRDGRRVSSRETEADEYGVPPEVLAWLDTRFVIRRVIEGGVVCYEIAHDRLAGAVRRDNLRWRRERLTPFERAAAVWANTAKPRPAELLVGGAVLAEGEAADRAGWLDDDETEFL